MKKSDYGKKKKAILQKVDFWKGDFRKDDFEKSWVWCSLYSYARCNLYFYVCVPGTFVSVHITGPKLSRDLSKNKKKEEQTVE